MCHASCLWIAALYRHKHALDRNVGFVGHWQGNPMNIIVNVVSCALQFSEVEFQIPNTISRPYFHQLFNCLCITVIQASCY